MESKTSSTPDGVLIPATQGLEMAKANARREIDRMAKLRRREKLTFALLIGVSLIAAACWTYSSAAAQRGVEQSGQAVREKIAKEHPELAAKVGPSINCAVTRQKSQIGPLHYIKMTPGAMSESIGVHALACAQGQSEQTLADMRVALFQPAIH